MDSLEVGDVVQLKSGSPNMTVNGLDRGTRWHCAWFDYNACIPRNFTFEEAMLRKVPTEEPAPALYIHG